MGIKIIYNEQECIIQRNGEIRPVLI